MPEKLLHEMVPGHWIHSHEEDTPTEMVFRPASFRFPPSRGRLGFELKADGTYVETGIGPTDKPQEAEGTWRMADDNPLQVHLDANLGPRRILRIASAAPDRLVIQK